MKSWQVVGVNSKLYFIDVLIVDFYENWKLDFELMNSKLIFNARGVNIDEYLDWLILTRYLYITGDYLDYFDQVIMQLFLMRYEMLTDCMR